MKEGYFTCNIMLCVKFHFRMRIIDDKNRYKLYLRIIFTIEIIKRDAIQDIISKNEI